LNASERVRTPNVNRIIKSSIGLEFLYSSQNILVSYCQLSSASCDSGLAFPLT
jgi:hypothetical protein